MGLEEFEKELAQGHKERSHRHRSHSGDREHKHRHRHHHRSDRHRDRSRDRENDKNRSRRHKRRHDRDDDDGERRQRKRQRSDSPKGKRYEEEIKVFDSDHGDDEEDEWVEKEAETAPPEEDILDNRDQSASTSRVQRDAWMQEPAGLGVEYKRPRKEEEPKSQFVSAKDQHEFKVHQSEVKSHLADLERDFASDEEAEGDAPVKDEPAQHEVSYTFGDAGSSWRMTKLKAVYRQAEEKGRPVDDVALDTYGDLRDFDDAREEEREMDRRKMYGKDYVGTIKPSGELFEERKLKAGIHREKRAEGSNSPKPLTEVQGEVMEEKEAPKKTVQLDATALNKLKAQMMKAKLMKASNAAQLEEEYNIAASAGVAKEAQPDVVVLNQMENRMLAGDRSGEVTAISGKRGRERGLVEENEDMSVEDMVKHEKRTRGQHGGEGREFAERIAKDTKFDNDLDYMDENANKLSKKVAKSEINLRNTAIGDFQKMRKILDSCPLCYQEDSDRPPLAPVVSLATRTYLTLPTEPELVKTSAMIVPLQHRLNLLECDDDEWEEIRNFMKSLTRFYNSRDTSVIFYENAAHMSTRKGHAALTAIPLPHHLAETAAAYFKESILASDEQWSQHKPIIDTLALTQRAGYGKQAFRKSMVKEMPYFHVWFTLDGGMGHVIEDERRWPKGDLFAREVIGGMLDLGPEVIKRQGRWEKADRRLESFRKRWGPFDWTKVLMEGAQ
ncbi:hypothetical protein MBLNU230_g4449t1 [Neophaeotheca triangularis]